jgi:hypothetical protein
VWAIIVHTVRNLLTRGNGKLGEGIHAWSLPAVETCPGRSALCERVCYAREGRFRTHLLQDRLAENLDAALADNFVARVAAEIRRRGIHTVRVHVSGDFFSAEYVRKWVAIARRSSRTRFYAYTRSWRVPEIASALAELARLRNGRLWYSHDAETGTPAEVPAGVRLAYLQTERSDTPHGDLVFRTRPLRSEPPGKISLRLLCPTEMPGSRVGQVTCTSCRRCHR